MLTAFGRGIWLADGPAPVAVAGFRYPTRMAVIRLDDGGLFVWSPVALTDPLRAAIAAIGEVAYIVAPNTLHDLYIAAWKRDFPAARLHALPALIARHKAIAFDAELSDTPAPDWAGQIDQVVVAGNAIATETVFFHRASGTALFTDLIQHFPKDWFTGWRALVARLDLMTADEPAVPRFQAEGLVFREWRSLCWAHCYAVLDAVNAGEREIPTSVELIAELPPLALPA